MLLFALNPPSGNKKSSRKAKGSKKMAKKRKSSVRLSPRARAGRPLVRGRWSFPMPAVRGRPYQGGSVYTAKFHRGKPSSKLTNYSLLKGDWVRPVKMKGKKKIQLVLNPLGGIRRGVEDVLAPIRRQGVVGVAALAVGGGAGFLLPHVVAGVLKRHAPAVVTSGLVGVAVTAAASILAGSAVYRFAPQGVARKAGAAVAVGAMGAVILELAKMLPVVGPTIRQVSAGVPGLSGRRGMGDMTSVAQMVQGEALYSPAMGDFLQLSGGHMGAPVPASLFAGGLNDFVNFKNREDGRIAETISQIATSPLVAAPEQF